MMLIAFGIARRIQLPPDGPDKSMEEWAQFVGEPRLDNMLIALAGWALLIGNSAALVFRKETASLLRIGQTLLICFQLLIVGLAGSVGIGLKPGSPSFFLTAGIMLHLPWMLMLVPVAILILPIFLFSGILSSLSGGAVDILEGPTEKILWNVDRFVNAFMRWRGED